MSLDVKKGQFVFDDYFIRDSDLICLGCLLPDCDQKRHDCPWKKVRYGELTPAQVYYRKHVNPNPRVHKDLGEGARVEALRKSRREATRRFRAKKKLEVVI